MLLSQRCSCSAVMRVDVLHVAVNLLDMHASVKLTITGSCHTRTSSHAMTSTLIAYDCEGLRLDCSLHVLEPSVRFLVRGDLDSSRYVRRYPGRYFPSSFLCTVLSS